VAGPTLTAHWGVPDNDGVAGTTQQSTARFGDAYCAGAPESAFFELCRYRVSTLLPSRRHLPESASSKFSISLAARARNPGHRFLLKAVVARHQGRAPIQRGNVAIALWANLPFTGAALVAPFLKFGPISGDAFQSGRNHRDALSGG